MQVNVSIHYLANILLAMGAHFNQAQTLGCVLLFLFMHDKMSVCSLPLLVQISAPPSKSTNKVTEVCDLDIATDVKHQHFYLLILIFLSCNFFPQKIVFFNIQTSASLLLSWKNTVCTFFQLRVCEQNSKTSWSSNFFFFAAVKKNTNRTLFIIQLMFKSERAAGRAALSSADN